MKKLSTTQQKIVNLLSSDHTAFIIESDLWDWNELRNNTNTYQCIWFKRPTFNALSRLGYIIKADDYRKTYKKWILTPNIIL